MDGAGERVFHHDIETELIYVQDNKVAVREVNTANPRLSKMRQKEYKALLTDKPITAFKRTLKSVVIYFRDQRIQFVSILLGQVCELGKGTRNENALQDILVQVSQKTSDGA